MLSFASVNADMTDTLVQVFAANIVVMAYVVIAYTVMAYIVIAYMVMAYIVMAYIVMAYIVMAYIAMACIVMADIVMAYIAMAYIAMAYIVMALFVMAYIVMAYIIMAYTVMPWCESPGASFRAKQTLASPCTGLTWHGRVRWPRPARSRISGTPSRLRPTGDKAHMHVCARMHTHTYARVRGSTGQGPKKALFRRRSGGGEGVVWQEQGRVPFGF